MKKQLPSALLALAVLAGACSSVQYDDPDKVETLTIDFGSTDLQTLAGSMVDSLIESPALTYVRKADEGQDPRTVIFVGRVNNRTSEHIDTEGITDSIKTALLKSGKFRFATSPQGQSEIEEQVRFMQGSGRVDPAEAKAFGHQIGADVILYGNLRSIDKTKGRTLEAPSKREDVWYQFVLEAVNIETGEIIWANEKNIRKREKRSIFG